MRWVDQRFLFGISDGVDPGALAIPALLVPTLPGDVGAGESGIQVADQSLWLIARQDHIGGIQQFTLTIESDHGQIEIGAIGQHGCCAFRKGVLDRTEVMDALPAHVPQGRAKLFGESHGHD